MGMGEMKDASRRRSSFRSVGWRFASNSQCQRGGSYGELRIGCSKKEVGIPNGASAGASQAAFGRRG